MTTTEPGFRESLRQVRQLVPEVARGLTVTVFLAVLAAAGRLLVPVTVRTAVDAGLQPGSGAADIAVVRWSVAAAVAGVAITAIAAYATNIRMYRTAERTLATVRRAAFRHVHDLSVLTQDSDRRGSLVSRVTADVDTVSAFVQWGGTILVVSVLQLIVASVLMLGYSWKLTILVWGVFGPLILALRLFQRSVSRSYGLVRERVGTMLAAVSESVVGAETVRAYGVQERTARRVAEAIDRQREAATAAQLRVALSFSTGEVVTGIAGAAVVVAGVFLGVDRELTLGGLLAFLFLLVLFVTPLQAGTEVLNEAQNALAGWRRVVGILDTPAEVADPTTARPLPTGPLGVRFSAVNFSYPGGPPVLSDINVSIAPRARVAIVGETGSGKSTFVKLVARLMDPASGAVTIGKVPLPEIRFSELRRRVVLVPQDGFLFSGSIAANIRMGRPDATDDELVTVLTELGLADWVAGLPAGLATPVGQRGEQLSTGERQLVSLARAHCVGPDLLVLDEATSAVDPATEMRIGRALRRLMSGRTVVTVAHRLATAEAADDILVFDSGRIAERGPHETLVGLGGVYSRLHTAWSQGTIAL
jgi:ATP-binding cassette, subfamily B, bacterial